MTVSLTTVHTAKEFETGLQDRIRLFDVDEPRNVPTEPSTGRCQPCPYAAACGGPCKMGTNIGEED